MYVIGVTGALGSGKTIVARLLSEYMSAPVIDTAKIIRHLVQPNMPVFHELVSAYGEGILTNGNICQSKINKILFDEYKRIDTIISPAIHEEITNQLSKYKLLNT